jgi:hypothetical protein
MLPNCVSFRRSLNEPGSQCNSYCCIGYLRVRDEDMLSCEAITEHLLQTLYLRLIMI